MFLYTHYIIYNLVLNIYLDINNISHLLKFCLLNVHVSFLFHFMFDLRLYDLISCISIVRGGARVFA